MFTSVVHALVAGTGVTRAAVLTFDDAGVMRFRAAHGLSSAYMKAVDGHSPWSPTSSDPSPILVDDAASHPATDGLRDVLAAEGIGGLAFLPLRGDGRLLGKFMLYTESATEWGAVDLGFAGAASDLLASFLLRERALDRAHQARKMESLGLLAGGIAHDFNNLLTSMLGYVDMLRADTISGTPAREHAEHMRSVVEQASDVTRQLLSFARPENVPTESVSLTALLDEALPRLRALCGPRYDIRAEYGGTLATVNANRAQLHTLLLNLVTNARDAMANGGLILLHLRRGDRDGQVVLSVIDSGVGMDDATRARIFEPLFTTKMIGHGAGLGLATCYGIVSRLGGDITVRSTVGVGSEFIVRLPLAGVDVQPQRIVTTPVAAHRPVVLLVDDQEFVLAPIAHMLKASGYDVRTAADGVAALDLLATQPVSVVVSDVTMPEMDGVELVGHIAQRWPGVPVMLMTGFVEGSRELPAGVPVLLKPFRPRELTFQIERLLQAAPRSASAPHARSR